MVEMISILFSLLSYLKIIGTRPLVDIKKEEFNARPWMIYRTVLWFLI